MGRSFSSGGSRGSNLSRLDGGPEPRADRPAANTSLEVAGRLGMLTRQTSRITTAQDLPIIWQTEAREFVSSSTGPVSVNATSPDEREKTGERERMRAGRQRVAPELLIHVDACIRGGTGRPSSPPIRRIGSSAGFTLCRASSATLGRRTTTRRRPRRCRR